MPEQTLLKFYSTRLAFIKYYFLGILLVILAIVLYSGTIRFFSFLDPYKINFLFLIPVGVVVVAVAEIKRISDVYMITNFRILERWGILAKNEESVPLEKIANYGIDQSVIGRIFGVGDISIESSGGSAEPEIVIKKAPKVKSIKELLDKIIHK